MADKPEKHAYENVKTSRCEEGHSVWLDAQPLRTPAGSVLALPEPALAEAIAEEWRQQQETSPDPATMPLTRLACTAIDRVVPARGPVEAEALAHLHSDVVCYFASEPQSLIERQEAQWNPVILWATRRYDVFLEMTHGVMPLTQPVETEQRLGNALAALDVFSLTAVAHITGELGSLLLSLAIADGELNTDEACDAALLDEIFQAESWGEEPEKMQRLAEIRTSTGDAARFLGLLTTTGG